MPLHAGRGICCPDAHLSESSTAPFRTVHGPRVARHLVWAGVREPCGFPCGWQYPRAHKQRRIACDHARDGGGRSVTGAATMVSTFLPKLRDKKMKRDGVNGDGCADDEKSRDAVTE
ncbi:hypothetical protein MRX96_001990 [Rhipicephalus microplus]